MTDHADITYVNQRYCEAQSKASRINRDALFEVLASNCVNAVTVEFDGEGDREQILQITARNGDAIAPLPDLRFALCRADYRTGELTSAKVSLRLALETLCCSLLHEKYRGWANAEGAFGEFTFNVTERKIDLAFNARFTDFVTFNHSF